MRQVARKLFKQLLEDGNGIYIVTNDGNFEKKFYAGSDEEAIKIAGMGYGGIVKRYAFSMCDIHNCQIPEVGEMFRVGPDVGRCIAKTFNHIDDSITCMMLVDSDE